MLLQEILGMPMMRFITVYIAQGLVAVIFLILATKILKRDKKRLNVIFAGFYLSVAIGIIVNWIYAPIKISLFDAIMGTVTTSGTIFGLGFLVIFELILLKSEKVITPKKQILILIMQGALITGLFILVFIPDAGVNVDAATNWVPEWNLPYFLYAVIITTFTMIPTVYWAMKINQKFEDPQLKKKWKLFIIGYFELVGFVYLIFTSNYVASLDIDIRTIAGLLGLVLVITGGFLLYYGVGRQIEK